ncbi:helix-turn-helix transcriptional regulator [Plantactinospora soyae]|uniref:AraC-like DNA-binding protein n=1 Tax=Plantactinospora soyae TaxID=1544732 RepID=A0A927QZN1_9ACTN|nr:helix-turn-helix transcriptional regulator [Plantactinospora soyae]MBE1489242.1 AraC-like DNA-binding protein [Plantactinospora soyae]
MWISFTASIDDVDERGVVRPLTQDGGEGQSLTAHIRDRRLHEARAALADGRLSVSEIAAHWQFADGSHLSRLFKRRYGMSPTEFIRAGAGRFEPRAERAA